jgi:hypothetical protein
MARSRVGGPECWVRRMMNSVGCELIADCKCLMR